MLASGGTVMRYGTARALITLAGVVLSSAPALAGDAATSGSGTVVGSVEVHHEWTSEAPSHKYESQRSKSWRFQLARATADEAGYVQQGRIDAHEGGPRAFSLSLPARAYQVFEAQNATTWGSSVMQIPIRARFDVASGKTIYVGRLVLYVQRGKMGFPTYARDVVDCRAVDLALLAQTQRLPGADDIETELLRLDPLPRQKEPPTHAGCEIGVAPDAGAGDR